MARESTFSKRDGEGQEPQWFLPGACGIDEAGRGPLAGPVYAAAVILPPDFDLAILNDSKKLSEGRRMAAFGRIIANSRHGIAWVGPGEIDRINILQASLLAMARAYQGLLSDGLGPAPLIWVDGNKAPPIAASLRCQVKGDALIPAVMAASILAKVARDRDMERWSWIYPEYGYERHKGYPTAEHRATCRRLGPSPIQRLSFSYKE